MRSSSVQSDYVSNNAGGMKLGAKKDDEKNGLDFEKTNGEQNYWRFWLRKS